MRENYPTLDALIKLSEKAPLDASVKPVLDERGDRLMEQANLGYVVIDERFIPPDRAAMVIEAFKLREVQRTRTSRSTSRNKKLGERGLKPQLISSRLKPSLS